MATATPNQQCSLAGNINEPNGIRDDFFPTQKEPGSAKRNATEQLLRQIFTRHKELPTASDEELTKEVSRAFQLFRSDFSDFPGPRRNDDKEREIREQISNLQKRTTDTLEVFTNCKENVSSVVFGTNPELSCDIDESMTFESKSLSGLSEEIKKIQSRIPSSSISSMERPDIEDMKNATDQLQDDLKRISKNYAGAGEKKTWLSKFSGKRP